MSVSSIYNAIDAELWKPVLMNRTPAITPSYDASQKTSLHLETHEQVKYPLSHPQTLT